MINVGTGDISGAKQQTNQTYFIMNKGGKFLKKLWCCVGGRV